MSAGWCLFACVHVYWNFFICPKSILRRLNGRGRMPAQRMNGRGVRVRRYSKELDLLAKSISGTEVALIHENSSENWGYFSAKPIQTRIQHTRRNTKCKRQDHAIFQPRRTYYINGIYNWWNNVLRHKCMKSSENFISKSWLLNVLDGSMLIFIVESRASIIHITVSHWAKDRSLLIQISIVENVIKISAQMRPVALDYICFYYITHFISSFVLLTTNFSAIKLRGKNDKYFIIFNDSYACVYMRYKGAGSKSMMSLFGYIFILHN